MFSYIECAHDPSDFSVRAYVIECAREAILKLSYVKVVNSIAVNKLPQPTYTCSFRTTQSIVNYIHASYSFPTNVNGH